MSNKLALGIAALALVLSGVACFQSSHAPSLGGQLYNFNQTNFANGFSAGKASQFEVSSTGDLTLTTSNSATSTLKVGCVQMYATSTATAVHLEFSTSTTLATYSGGVAPTGAVAWRYGTCPR